MGAVVETITGVVVPAECPGPSPMPTHSPLGQPRHPCCQPPNSPVGCSPPQLLAQHQVPTEGVGAISRWGRCEPWGVQPVPGGPLPIGILVSRVIVGVKDKVKDCPPRKGS